MTASSIRRCRKSLEAVGPLQKYQETNKFMAKLQTHMSPLAASFCGLRITMDQPDERRSQHGDELRPRQVQLQSAASEPICCWHYQRPGHPNRASGDLEFMALQLTSTYNLSQAWSLIYVGNIQKLRAPNLCLQDDCCGLATPLSCLAQRARRNTTVLGVHTAFSYIPSAGHQDISRQKISRGFVIWYKERPRIEWCKMFILFCLVK